MKTNTIIKALAFAMLLATACNKSEIANDENTDKKGFALPVTVNVTREGDDATKAAYNESTKKLAFSAGDKLFVYGSHEKADRFAGTLDYVPATGKFSGTIYTESPYEGTIDDLLNGNYATLLPAGYESTGYLTISDDGYQASLEESPWKSFATSKAAGVEQLSFEHGEYTIGTGFELEPQKAILNFTITGLTASTNVTATLSDDDDSTPDIEGEVTTDGSGNATFAIGLEDGSDLNEFSLSVAGNAITLVSSSKVLEAGKIYNINRSASAPLPAVFTVDAGKTVKFSKGNLQATYNGSSWIWGFAEHQWDYIGDAAGNTSINGDGTVSANNVTVDLFGWVGASSTWTGAAQYGISNSKTSDSYGNVAGEAQKVGWGTTVGAGWRILTRLEWLHLLNERETGITVNSTNHARYTQAIINTDGTAVKGLIIIPDNYAGGSPAGVSWGTINAKSAFSTTCTSAGWTALEAAGCVFLPAAGYREATTITDPGKGAGYWSSNSSSTTSAFSIYFESDYLSVQFGLGRRYGASVRLVRDAD